MRISDWSSDVCSSDLGYGVRLVRGPAELGAYLEGFPAGEAFILQDYVDWQGEAGVLYVRLPGEPAGRIFSLGFRSFPHVVGDGRSRSEEHTSELQSLMRISYAVFFLKKKKQLNR